MKGRLPILFVLILCFAQGAFGQELTILHTNDIHSKLTGFGPESDYSPLLINNDSTKGGFARLSALIKKYRDIAPEQTLVVDAGDFLMGSLFHVPEKETGFQLRLMKKMGFEYTTLGNHEFDFGPGVLAQIFQKASASGEIPRIVSSNINFSKNEEDNDLEELYKKGMILPYDIIVKNGIRIGIFGLLGKDAASVAPAAFPVSFSDPAKTAKKTSEYLKKTGKADLIILLSHAGFNQISDKNYAGEDFEIARKAPEIDIIISGHTHVKTTEFLRSGKTYIVQAGCYAEDIGKIDLVFSEGKITEFKFNLIPVDDSIKGDEQVQREIEEYIQFIDQNYLAKKNLTCSQLIGKTTFDLTLDFDDLKSGNLAPFIADASRYYINSTGNKTDISLVASGTIRENIVAGESKRITTADLFRVMSLGNGNDDFPGYPLASIYLTGRELRNMAEAIEMLRKKGGDGFVYLSGLTYDYDESKGFMKKVGKVYVNNEIADQSKKNKKLYSVSANTYLLSFIGRIKKVSYGLLKVVPKDQNGKPVTDMTNQLIDIEPDKNGIQEAREWIALIEYIRSFEKNSEGLPVIPEKYRK